MRRVLYLFLISCFVLYADTEIEETPNFHELTTKFIEPAKNPEIVNSWVPYWLCLAQPKKSPLFQTNIGVGFLYFSGVKGNFASVPGNIANSSGADSPLEGKLSYNRTPLFEYLLGYRINYWFKPCLSYQQQSGVCVQTTPRNNPAYSSLVPARLITTIFKANLNLNTILAKFIFEYPIPMIWKNLAYSPYLGLGFGPSWQSWTNLELSQIQTASFSTTARVVEQAFKQKICPNFMWMFDIGVRVRSTQVESNFFFVAGIKYNQWGQARNLGELSQQGDAKLGFLTPFAIKTVFSFAPYFGAQFNFPTYFSNKTPPKLDGHNLDTWKPFLVPSFCLGDVKTVYTESNVGLGCLYFRGVKGSLSSRPRDPINNQPSLVPYKNGGINYNRTPLFEFITGFRLKPYLRAVLSYQHQSDVAISTNIQDYEILNPALGLTNSKTYAQFKGNLILDSLMAKVFIETPSAIVWRRMAYSPYAAVGLGPGWQTWVQMNVWRYTNAPTSNLTSSASPLRNKVCANLVFMVDVGVRFKSVSTKIPFSAIIGCKYNQWGKATNLGKISQSAYRSYGLFPPLQMNNVLSLAPYAGVSWDYPIHNRNSYKVEINKHSTNTWKPFLAPLNQIQNKQAVWAEYSLGVGFLYFHKISGQLAQTPTADGAGFTGIPKMNRTLSYNRTPLYEFMIGYRYYNWMRACLSYQMQRNVAIATDVYKVSPRGTTDNAVQLTANLEFDSLMGKVYFESPVAIMLKNLATSLYVGLGLGPSWQSWTEIEYSLASLGGRNAQYYSEKICANVSFMVDTGFRVQSVFSKGVFSVTKGIKFIHWGQARNIGKLSQQSSLKTGLFKPLSIQVIYSFSPYLGVQWNY